MSAEHPSEERWEAFACGELSADERRALLAHAAGCALCERTREALVLLRDEARFFDPGVPRKRSVTPWYVVGMLAAVAAAFVLLLRAPPATQDTLRGSQQGIVLVSSTPPFTWEPVAGATEYMVRVYRETGELAWSGRTSATTIAPSLAPGAYRWEVEALAAGAPLARSRLERFSVAR